MKSLNLTGSQAEIVVKSLNERLYEFDEELDALESRIIEIRMKKSQLNNLLVELGGSPSTGDGPKKRGRKPGSGKVAAPAGDTAPKKRGRKPGSGKKVATPASDAAPKKRGRKPGSGKKAAAPAGDAAPKKRGRKPGPKAAAPKKSVAKAAPAKKAEAAPKAAAKKSAAKAATPAKKAEAAPKAAAKKTAAKTAAPAKKAEAAPKAEKTVAKKAEKNGKRGRKSGGENTLASKIVTAINEAKRGLSTREIVDAINSRYGAEKDERKLIQAVSSTLISLTKRGKIKRENGADGQILNIVVS